MEAKTVIDFSKAPKGAELYALDSWYKYSNNILFVYKENVPSGGNSTSCWCLSDYTKDELKNITARPESKPVFTQEMADKGVLPSVGMMVEFTADLFEVIFTYENQVWIKSKTKAISRLVHISDIKPIDTRTDEEKAIEDLSKLVGDCESDYGILKAIKAGKIHGVTWSKS